MSVRCYFRWYDLWVGVYIDKSNQTLYVCPLPCIIVRIEWGRE